MQVLPPRQRATLLLRDVMGYSATKVASMLETSSAGVNSSLQRARGTLAQERIAGRIARTHGPGDPDANQLLVRRLVDAWHAADVASIVAVLTEDALLAMPPQLMRYVGRDEIAVFLATVPGGGRLERFRLVPTRANRQPALATYYRAGDAGEYHAHGVLVLSIAGGAISSLTRFVSPNLVERFGLPSSIIRNPSRREMHTGRTGGDSAMPRRLTLAPHLSIADLEHRYRAAHDPVARSQWQMLWPLARGEPSERVAEPTGYSVKGVRRVAARYSVGGPDAVGDQRHRLPGRADRRLLTPALAAELSVALAGPAPDGGLGTSRTVARWMSERLGRPVAVQRGWDALRAVGFTPQRPRPRAVTADPDAQAAFKKGGSSGRSPPPPPPPPIPTR